MGRYVLIAALAAAFAVPAGAAAQYGNPYPPSDGGGSGSAKSPSAQVGANGNPFSGGLSYTPPKVSVGVGQVVQWTNTDSVVPHTVTEDHNLFDLSGTYGVPGAMGFGPGESVQREFSAGTFNYFCRVHPTQMKGTVTVPLTISAGRVRHKRYRATVTWSEQAPDPGQVFDLQMMKGNSGWQTVRNGTTQERATFRLRKGKRFSFRSRVRKADDVTVASDYSPVAAVRR
jgi:plastocyanin